MKKRLFAAAVVLALILVALPVMSALAGDIFRISGKGADAFFFSSTGGPSGCTTDTFVGVFANDGSFQSPPGPGSAGSGAFVSIDQFAVCPFASPLPLVSVFGFASLADPDFRVNQGLTSAKLNTTIPGFDSVSSLPVNVDVDLSWTGTGDLTGEISNFHFHSPGFIVNGRFRGTSRPAQASGSVSIGTTNFTPAPSVFGLMMSAKSGQVTIQ